MEVQIFFPARSHKGGRGGGGRVSFQVQVRDFGSHLLGSFFGGRKNCKWEKEGRSSFKKFFFSVLRRVGRDRGGGERYKKGEKSPKGPNQAQPLSLVLEEEREERRATTTDSSEFVKDRECSRHLINASLEGVLKASRKQKQQAGFSFSSAHSQFVL